MALKIFRLPELWNRKLRKTKSADILEHDNAHTGDSSASSTPIPLQLSAAHRLAALPEKAPEEAHDDGLTDRAYDRRGETDLLGVDAPGLLRFDFTRRRPVRNAGH